jgi:hypothetical protein
MKADRQKFMAAAEFRHWNIIHNHEMQIP